MTFLRAIRDDLVEKRLWPVALALVLALVAVPVVLARGGGDAASTLPLPDPAVQEQPVAGKTSQPVVLTDTRRLAPTGQYRDPFRKPKGAATTAKPAAQDGVAVIAPAAAADVGASGSSPSPSPSSGGTSPGATTVPVTPGAGTPATTPPAHAPTPSPSPPASRAHAAGYRVDLSWGSTAAPRGLHDVARLTPLESNGQPAVVFMGVRPDGKTALFLLIADDGGGSGDAHCRPSVDLCRMLEMQAGDTQFLDVATTDGMRQYELHVDRVAARTAATPAAADRLRGRVSKAGRKLVTDTIDSGRTFVSLYRYAPARGVVVFSANPSSKRAAASALGELQRVQGPPAQ